MAEIRPFRAWRYNVAAAGEMAAIVAPPYDVIDDAHRDALYDRSPYNVVRLILAREEDRYSSAKACMQKWIAEKILLQDDEPALYVYSQQFSNEGMTRERMGVIGAVRLEPFSSGKIKPHEKTLAGPKADRMRLMEATQANLSPIFGLYEGSSAVDHANSSAAPLNDVTDEFGVRHRLWVIRDQSVTNRIASELAPRTIYIADGHHRYETALAYRDKLAARGQLAPDHPANFIMIFLCSMSDPGLLVLPTHRLVANLRDFDAARFLDGLRPLFALREFPNTDQGLVQLVAAMQQGNRRGVFGFCVRGIGSLYMASLAEESLMLRAAPTMAPALRQLDVSLLDVIVLRKLLGIDVHDAAHDGTLLYVKEAREAVRSVSEGRADVACLLNATRVEEVEAVCDEGETMPEKSTYFHPKLGTGFVFHMLR